MGEKDDDFKLKNDLLYHNARLCISKDYKVCTEILDQSHIKEAGHFGEEKTLALLEKNYYWPALKKDVVEYCKTCDICQHIKTSTQKPTGMLKPIPVPKRS